MDAVGAVDIGAAGGTEHHGVARGQTAIAVRRRIGVMIGLDLDDRPANTVDQERGANQVRRNVMDAPIEKLLTELRR